MQEKSHLENAIDWRKHCLDNVVDKRQSLFGDMKIIYEIAERMVVQA